VQAWIRQINPFRLSSQITVEASLQLCGAERMKQSTGGSVDEELAANAARSLSSDLYGTPALFVQP